jgi:regulator of sigma E protease
MRVDEFAFGFPPALFRRKYGETVYSINLIPLGGYVKIFGENGLDGSEVAKLSDHEKKGLFSNKIWWQKIVVLAGGVMFNILAAVILFAFAFMQGTNIYLEEDEISSTPANARQMILVDMADKSAFLGSGISLGDKIVEIHADGEVLTGEDLSSYSATSFVQAHNNSQIQVSFIDSKGNFKQVTVVPKAGIVDGKKVLGAKFADQTFKKYGFFESIQEGSNVAVDQLKYIFTSLIGLVHDMIYKDAKVEDSISGPIGLAVMTTKVSEKGISQILIFAAMLSLSLAVFNILPIPALDGGRIVFVLLEVAIRKKIKASYEQLFHGLGFLALLCLMVFVTYFDIVKALS